MLSRTCHGGNDDASLSSLSFISLFHHSLSSAMMKETRVSFIESDVSLSSRVIHESDDVSLSSLPFGESHEASL